MAGTVLVQVFGGMIAGNDIRPTYNCSIRLAKSHPVAVGVDMGEKVRVVHRLTAAGFNPAVALPDRVRVVVVHQIVSSSYMCDPGQELVGGGLPRRGTAPRLRPRT